MKLSHCTLILSVIAIALAGCAKTTTVYRLENGETAKRLGEKKRGVHYFLPRTVITIQGTVTEVTKTRGAYCYKDGETEEGDITKNSFKELLDTMGIQFDEKKIVTVGGVTHRIHDVSTTVSAEPDCSQAFFVELEGGLMTERSLTLKLGQLGVMASADAKAADRSFAISMALAKQTVGLAGAVLLAGPGGTGSKGGSLLDQAKAEAEQYNALRNDYEQFVSGKNTVVTAMQSEVFTSIKKQYEDRLKAIKEEFLGETKEGGKPFKVVLRPAAPTEDGENVRIPLFTVTSEGLVGTDSSDGSLKIKCLPFSGATGGSMECIVTAVLSPAPGTTAALKLLRPLAEAQQPKMDACGNAEPTGLCYRAPVKYTLTLEGLGKDEKDQGDLVIAQFGPVLSLPRRMNLLGGDSKIVYHQDTGAIEELTVSSKSLDVSGASSLMETATSTITKVKAQDETLGKLQQQYDILKLKAGIKGFEAELAE